MSSRWRVEELRRCRGTTARRSWAWWWSWRRSTSAATSIASGRRPGPIWVEGPLLFLCTVAPGAVSRRSDGVLLGTLGFIPAGRCCVWPLPVGQEARKGGRCCSPSYGVVVVGRRCMTRWWEINGVVDPAVLHPPDGGSARKTLLRVCRRLLCGRDRGDWTERNGAAAVIASSVGR